MTKNISFFLFLTPSVESLTEFALKLKITLIAEQLR